MSTSRVVTRRNEDGHSARRLDRTALGRQGKSPSIAITMTAATWVVGSYFSSKRLPFLGDGRIAGMCQKKKCIFAIDMEKEKLIKAIQQKGLSNSLISLYYNIGRALPFRAQRFLDGRVSSWYFSQYVEVHEVKP